MRFKEVQHALNIPAFNYRVKVIFTNDINKSLKKRKQDEADEYTSALHSYDTGGYSTLYFRSGISYGALAHECWHCVRAMLIKWAGAELENETVAYHLGYLVDEVVRLSLKRRNKNDRGRKRKTAIKRGNRRRREHNPTTEGSPTTEVRTN